LKLGKEEEDDEKDCFFYNTNGHGGGVGNKKKTCTNIKRKFSRPPKIYKKEGLCPSS
jgi:hypothetical protein